MLFLCKIRACLLENVYIGQGPCLLLSFYCMSQNTSHSGHNQYHLTNFDNLIRMRRRSRGTRQRSLKQAVVQVNSLNRPQEEKGRAVRWMSSLES